MTNKLSQRSLPHFLLSGISALALASCSFNAPIAETTNKPLSAQSKVQITNTEFLALADRHAAEIFQTSPEWATQMGVSAEIAGENFTRKLSDFSPKGNADLVELNQTLLAELEAIDPRSLSGTAAVTYEIMLHSYKLAARQNEYDMGVASVLWVNPPYAVDQLFGQHITLPRFFTSQIPITNREQLDDYLQRLEQLAAAITDVENLIKRDAQKGIVPPKFALDAVAKSAREFATPEAPVHPISVAASQKINALEDLSDAQKAEFKRRVITIVTDDIKPAFDAFSNSVEVLAESASDDAGIWRLPDGDKLYQIALENYGASGLTADEIHQIGLRDVERIHKEMDLILQDLGYYVGSVGSRMNSLSKNPEYLYPNTSEVKDGILRELEAYITDISTVAPEWFEEIPPQPIIVKRIPVYEEGTSAGAYYTQPALDGSQPGIFWINLKDTADWPKYALKSLVYHESIPGHHLQLSIQQNISDMPLIRNMVWFADYGEGWALYTEELAVEMGMYDNDPLGNLGRLKMELYRAARLVVDTGIHDKRWSRQEAIDWMVETTGETTESITREIDRYSVWPGQATSYKIGMIKMQRLREKAETTLGDAFDIRKFHSEILNIGAVPMSVLERRMDEWIKSQTSEG